MKRPLLFGKVILYVYCLILLVGISMMHDKPHLRCSAEAIRVVDFSQEKNMMESRSRKLMYDYDPYPTRDPYQYPMPSDPTPP
ncbi:hypothetical protein MKW94_014810 [Papaver nudicaule]|uniref:Uncharacterized protein n=1 Tax=Papaver nudicaule TaxID=74823 RepID=A0AA41RWW7_PAPNU|nr:hypothetical protein [Papaver nudicaule]